MSNWIIFPHRLNDLLVDPTDAHVDLFLAQIDAYLASLSAEILLGVGPGKQYMSLLARVRQPGTLLVYRVFAALVYLQCVQPSRENLHAKDRCFLDDFSRDVGHWLMGKRADGNSYPAESLDNHTCAFVVAQLDAYRWAFAHEQRTTGIPPQRAMLTSA